MWFGGRREQDFRDEIESHVRIEADRLIAEGLSGREAEAAARRAFGNIAIVREKFYESRRWLGFDQVMQDLRYGLRLLRKAPGFTAAVALTIALGLGANTAVFSLIDAVLLRSLPVQNPKQLVFLETRGVEGASGPPPYPCFTKLRAETDVFAGAAAFVSDELRVEIDGKAEQVMGQVASGNYFDVLGLKPALGRLMNAEDEKLNSPIAVISDRYWRRRFGADPAAIGKSISYRRQTFTIVGVTPSYFVGLRPGSPIDITFPIGIERELQADAGAFWLEGIIARLNSGVSSSRAEAESDAVFRSFMSASRHPADFVAKHFSRLQVIPAAHGTDVLRRRFSRPLYALMGVAALVLMLAIANVANLLLARGFTRRGEFGMRLAIGAGRGRILRQVLTETVLLFGLGAVPGIMLAGWGVRLIETFFQEGRRPVAVEAGLNGHVLTFSLIATLAGALIAGLFPAWRAVQIDPEQAIKEGESRISEPRNGALMTQALVAFQVGLSLVLLVGAVVFVRTLLNLRHIDPGFRNEDVLTLSIQLPDGLTKTSKYAGMWDQVLETVRAVPGVRAVGLATFAPLSGRDRGGMVKIRGYEPPTWEDGVVHIDQVSAGYFESLGIGLLRGRLLSDRDTAATMKVAVINESAARKYFRQRNPLGESLDFVRKGDNSSYRIVGVVQDTKHMNLRESSARFAFIPIRQARDVEQRVTLLVAPSQPNREMALLQPIRSGLMKVSPGILISDVITMRHQLDSTLVTERLLAGLSGAFGALALILACVGLYGVLSYQIGRQRQSIGIRMALGATPLTVASSVLRQSVVVISIGLLCGLPFAFWEARTAETMLWGVKASDPSTYLASAALLWVVGIVSAYLPARRASTIEPGIALRHG
jgi:predicted permease